MKTKTEQHTPYLIQVLLHKWFILMAGFKLKGVPLWRLCIHDWTKFLPIEFGVYRKRFTGRHYDKEAWKIALRHHYHSNPHHYEFWVLDGVPKPMPETYIREMVIDWLAAGRSYVGNWDIQPWINATEPKMTPMLHNETLVKLRHILHSIGLNWPTEPNAS